MLTDPDLTASCVRAARAFADLSREELSDKVGLSPRQLRSLENGKRANTTLEELASIADACAVPYEFMLSGFAPMQGMYAEFIAIIRKAMVVPLKELDRFEARYQRQSSGQDRAAKDEPPAS